VAGRTLDSNLLPVILPGAAAGNDTGQENVANRGRAAVSIRVRSNFDYEWIGRPPPLNPIPRTRQALIDGTLGHRRLLANRLHTAQEPSQEKKPAANAH